MRRRSCIFAAFILCVVLTLCTIRKSCHAAFVFLGPSPYFSVADSPFPLFSNPNFQFEDFEDDDCIPGPGVFCGGEFDVMGARLVTGGIVLGSSVDSDDGVIDNSGQTAYSGLADPVFGNPDLTRVTNILEVQFDREPLGFLPDAVGFVWTSGAGSLSSVRVFDAEGEPFTFSGANLSLSPFGSSDDRFVGFVNPLGINRIEVVRTTLTSEPDQFAPQIDHLQFGRLIPEPSTLALLTLGMGAMLRGAARRIAKY
jgi:hypothetical protein